MSRLPGFFLGAALLFGCTTTTPEWGAVAPEPGPDVEAGKELLGVPPDYRSVGYNAYGPSTSGLSSQTAVWTASRRWADVSGEAGPAWSANSGLTWDEKYARWVESLDPVTSDDGHVTVEITTPWGKELPSPRVECAELAMVLRTTFAAWYDLPFFMHAWSPTHGHMYFGHFGVVDGSGTRISGYPRYAVSYADHTDDFAGETDATIVANWPDDTTLEGRYLTQQKDDYNEFLGPDAYAGAYFDEIHLNKRVGHFLMTLLVNFGSVHVASETNTWNLEPVAMREGDVLIHRWQPQGIGHVMVVKDVDELPGGNLDAEIVFGSMPRIQPKWYSSSISKSYFTSQYAGGPALDGDGVPYSHHGGGLKRWRTPVTLNGSWVNIVPVSDRSDFIDGEDYPAIEGRITTFQQLLGNLTPAEQRDAILERIEMARDALRQHPASCANRQRREEAFDDLYALMQDEWGMSREAVDRDHRIFEDYIFAELEYTQSKTCCWNSTTEEMHAIIVEYNQDLYDDAAANEQCSQPVVFKARNGGGYDPFRAYAHSTGRGSQWVEWSADESCPQANVSEDVETNAPWSDFCDIADDVMGDGGSTDPGDDDDTGDDDTGDDDTGIDPGDDDDTGLPGTGGGSAGDCGSCSGANPVGGPFGMMTLAGMTVFFGRRRRA